MARSSASEETAPEAIVRKGERGRTRPARCRLHPAGVERRPIVATLVSFSPVRPLDETLPEAFDNAERLDNFDLAGASLRARTAIALDDEDGEF
jgi:hypothetical protein